MENKKVEKSYFDIVVNASVPAEIHYRVYAKDEIEALQLVPSSQPTNIKYFINVKRNIKLIIYSAGTKIIKLVKNF